MTRTATGRFSFIASIILFFGALLLAPQAGSAQESPECEGEQQTIITATGIKITTCNWDLDDAPINKAAAGLEPNIQLLAACACNYSSVPHKEFSKYGIKTISCTRSDILNPNFPGTQVTAKNKQNPPDDMGIVMVGQIEVVDDGNPPDFDRCLIRITKGKLVKSTGVDGLLVINGLGDAGGQDCRDELEAYIESAPLEIECITLAP